MTQITQVQTASTRSQGDFDRLMRLPALFSAPSSVLRSLLQAFATAHRKTLASRQQEEAFLRLDQLDEHRLHDIGLLRVEEIVGWRIAARGAAPIAIIRLSYQRLPGTENNRATASQKFGSAEPANIWPPASRPVTDGGDRLVRDLNLGNLTKDDFRIP